MGELNAFFNALIVIVAHRQDKRTDPYKAILCTFKSRDTNKTVHDGSVEVF